LTWRFFLLRVSPFGAKAFFSSSSRRWTRCSHVYFFNAREKVRPLTGLFLNAVLSSCNLSLCCPSRSTGRAHLLGGFFFRQDSETFWRSASAKAGVFSPSSLIQVCPRVVFLSPSRALLSLLTLPSVEVIWKADHSRPHEVRCRFSSIPVLTNPLRFPSPFKGPYDVI